MSLGVKVAMSFWPLPAFRTVPAGGAYANVPGTFAVAFSCVPLSGVPYTSGAGLLQLITGLIFDPLGAGAGGNKRPAATISLAWLGLDQRSLATAPPPFS